PTRAGGVERWGPRGRPAPPPHRRRAVERARQAERGHREREPRLACGTDRGETVADRHDRESFADQQPLNLGAPRGIVIDQKHMMPSRMHRLSPPGWGRRRKVIILSSPPQSATVFVTAFHEI